MANTTYNRYNGPLISPEQARKLRKEIRAWRMDYLPRALFYRLQNSSYTLEDITENFTALLPASGREVFIGGDDFEAGGTPAAWVFSQTAGAPVYSYVTDPVAGAAHGRVLKVQFGTTDKPLFYAESIGQQGDLQGIYSGKLDFYMYISANVSWLWSVTNRTNNNQLGKGYSIQRGPNFGGSSRFGAVRHDPANLSAPSVEFASGTKTVSASVWHHHELWWYSAKHPTYGDLFFMYWSVDGTPVVTLSPQVCPYFYDDEQVVFPAPLPSDDPTARIMFYFEQSLGGTPFVLLDSVKFYKYENVRLVFQAEQ